MYCTNIRTVQGLREKKEEKKDPTPTLRWCAVRQSNKSKESVEEKLKEENSQKEDEEASGFHSDVDENDHSDESYSDSDSEARRMKSMMANFLGSEEEEEESDSGSDYEVGELMDASFIGGNQSNYEATSGNGDGSTNYFDVDSKDYSDRDNFWQ